MVSEVVASHELNDSEHGSGRSARKSSAACAGLRRAACAWGVRPSSRSTRSSPRQLPPRSRGTLQRIRAPDPNAQAVHSHHARKGRGIAASELIIRNRWMRTSGALALAADLELAMSIALLHGPKLRGARQRHQTAPSMMPIMLADLKLKMSIVLLYGQKL